jgi:hypothetical protein
MVCVYGCVRVECLRLLQYCGSVCPAAASSPMHAISDGDLSSSIVDVYNCTTRAWSTAQLSQARPFLQFAAASVLNMALFGGGYPFVGGASLCRDGVVGRIVDDFVRVWCLRMLLYGCYVCLAAASSLMRATAGVLPNVVDVYTVTTRAWSTANLSVARDGPTTVSVGNLVLFAGGQASALKCRGRGKGG